MRNTDAKTRTVKMIEPLQIKLIHTAVARLHLSDDDYRTILRGHYQASSCKALTYVEASRLIDYFKTLGFKIPPRKKYTAGTQHRTVIRHLPPNVILLPSRDQLDMIDALAGKIAWKVEDGFQRWLKKYLKTDRIKTADQASDAIEGLKGLLTHQAGERHGG